MSAAFCLRLVVRPPDSLVVRRMVVLSNMDGVNAIQAGTTSQFARHDAVRQASNVRSLSLHTNI